MRNGGFNSINTLDRRRAGRRSMVNNPAGIIEKKFLDGIQALNTDTTGSVTALNAMAQGTSQSTRIGNKITMKSLYVRWALGQGTTTATPPIVRVTILYDKQPNATLATLAEIYQVTGSSLTLSPMNMANRDRFIVLMDETYSPAYPYNDTAVTEFADFHKKYLKLNLDTIYNNTNGGTIADINTGALLVATSANVVSGTAEPTLTFSHRLRYIDC